MKKVLLLLLNGVEIYEFASFFDVLGWSNHYGDPVNVKVCGVQKEVTSTFGLELRSQLMIDDIDISDFDALAIPGGFGDFDFYDEAYSEKVLELVKKFDNDKKIIASICVGALPLGKSGVLENRCATTYHMMEGRRAKQLAEFNVEVKSDAIVEDNNIITSSGPGTAIDVAFRLLEKLTSQDNTKKIRQLMGF